MAGDGHGATLGTVIGRQGPSEGVTLRGTARRPGSSLFAIARSRLLFHADRYTMAVPDVAAVEYGSRDLHGLERRGRHEVR